MPSFTLNQKKAHDARRHISITANAGSGKTSVLVSRYCDLVEYRHYLPREIAAVTFTEKAASELRARIAAEIEARLGSVEHQEQWPTLKRAREEFPSAVVTTIHGFCAQLLREFPIEADVPPNFAVISGYERSDMEETALMAAIEEALAEPPEDERFLGAFDVARRIGRERMENLLRLMIANREGIELTRRGGALSHGREETVDHWERRIEAAVRSLLLNAETRPAIRRLIGLLRDKFVSEAEGLLAEIESAPTIEEILPRLDGLLKIFMTREGTPRKASFDVDGETTADLTASIAVLDAARKRASGFLDADVDPLVHTQLYDDARLLLSIFDRTTELYAARKGLIGGLDFEDLQLVLFRALDTSMMRNAVAGRFHYIMVDEFQDTNELQYEVVRRLARELVGPDLVCVVGDEKQSIYGFRGAEVEVFDRATDEFKKVNRDFGRGDLPLEYRTDEIEPDSRDEALGELRLNASFRLLPGICAYVNATCAPIMRRSPATGSGVEYDPLVCARRSDGRGKVEVILCPPRPEAAEMRHEEIEEKRESGGWCSESEMITRRILALISGAEPVVWECPSGGNAEELRPPRFGDIAILCRKRSMFEQLERSLRKYGIPYVTHGGSAYFRSQEVFDVVNYLRTLLSTRDEIALLGLLRSPFFAVSDDELYRIGRGRNERDDENSFWTKAVRHVESGEASEALRRAIEAIADDRAMSSRIPVSLLLKRIVERTGWRGAVIGSERGEQMLANADKLIDMARDFESRGFTNLFDFVERVAAQIDAAEMESEAAINTSRDAVRLMTMHAAKGLEFPIVILPSLHVTLPPPSPPFFDKDLGFGWNWTHNGREYRPAVTALMRMRRVERERAEEARLFYVAVTRARDFLIVSGECDYECPPRGTMLEWSLAALKGLPAENETLTLAAPDLPFLAEDGATIVHRPWEQEIDVYRSVSDIPRYQPIPHEVYRFREDLMRIGELAARAHGEIYSASQFLVYAQCPTKYYLRYRLGIPEELNLAYVRNPDATDTEDGTTFARLFRETAKRLDTIDARPGLELRRREAERVVEEVLVLEAMDQREVDRIRLRLLETIGGLLTTEAARARLFPEGSTAETAKELRVPVGEEYVLGVMDRMTTTQDGTISVLQFKTLRLEGADPARVAEGYLPQLRLYAWLVSLLNPKQRTITGTILFTERPDAPQDFAFSRFDMVRIETEVRTNIEDIRAITYSGRRDLPLRTPHCPICPYWIEEQCLLGKERC